MSKILQPSFLDLESPGKDSREGLQGRTPGKDSCTMFARIVLFVNTIQCWKFYATVMLIKAFLSTKAVAF